MGPAGTLMATAYRRRRHSDGTVTRHRSGRPAGWLRALSGLFAGGLVVLALAVGVGWFAAMNGGSPGSETSTLFWHGVSAVVAVLAQRHADRHHDLGGMVAAVAVIGITVAVLTFQWLV